MKVLLQSFTPYNKSIKWEINSNYYLKRGADAWLKGEVPYDITSNSYAGYQNALLLYHAVKDMEKNNQLDENEKINVLELASGVGLFAINFVDQFRKICENNNVNYFSRFQYFFSDFSEKNLKDASKNEYLKKLEKEGKIKFVIVDALNPTKIKNLKNNEPFKAIKFSAIVGNYIHDNLPVTILRKKDGNFYEKNIALSIETEDMSDEKIKSYKKDIINNPVEKEIMDKLIEEEKYEQIDEKELDPIHLEVIKEAVKEFEIATIVYPYGSFRSIKEALPLLKQGGIFVISDKGYADEYYMKGETAGVPSIHGNSHAHSVNFPLIEIFARKIGLFSYRTANMDYSLQTIVITPENNKHLEEEFKNLFVNENLNHESSSLQHVADDLDKNDKLDDAAIVLKQVLKIRKYDASVLFRMGRILYNANNYTEAIKCFEKGKEFDYFQKYDFDFEIGFTYYKLSEDDKAIKYYNESLANYGPSAIIFHNIGLCYFELKKYELAKSYFLLALSIDDEYEPSKNQLVKVVLILESTPKKAK